MAENINAFEIEKKAGVVQHKSERKDRKNKLEE